LVNAKLKNSNIDSVGPGFSSSPMDLSIIIVNYNAKRVIADCLRTIKKSQDKLNKETIVVDNASSDGSLAYIKKNFPWVRAYASGGNLGFARGNNFGIKRAKGKYVWLLNSDTLLKPDTIDKFYQLALKNNSDIASCRLLNQDGTIQPQGGFLPSLCRVIAWMLFIDDIPLIQLLIRPYQQRRLGFFKQDQHPGWLSGTSLLVRRQLYNSLKGLDKDIFMYAEDVEFCFRAAKRSIKLDYFAQPALTHLGQASGSSRGAVLGEYKGLKYIYQKHKAKWQYLLLRCLLKLGALLRIIVFGYILRDETKKAIYQEAFKLA